MIFCRIIGWFQKSPQKGFNSNIRFSRSVTSYTALNKMLRVMGTIGNCGLASIAKKTEHRAWYKWKGLSIFCTLAMKKKYSNSLQ